MLFRLSRILFWLAAIAAVAALVGPDSLATPMTALAGLALLAAYAAARWALQRARHAAPAASVEAPVLDDAALQDILARAQAALSVVGPGIEPAALAVAAVLRAELGARETSVHRVRAIAAPFAELVTLAADGQAGVAHRVRLERSPLGVALRDGCAVQGEGGSWAIPLPGSGAAAVLIELGAPALQAPPGALKALFASLGRLVRAANAAPASPPRDFLTPEDAPYLMPSQAAQGRCRTQYRGSDHSPDPLPASAVSDLQARPSAPAVLDAQALARLRELDPKGENNLVDRVLRAFESSALRLLPQLESARAAGDRAGVRHVAHTLKSSSASIGALTLSQHCAAVEALIREERPDDLEAPLAALLAELASVRQTIRSMLDA
ncbi:MAG: Hpt domain-containing protein [Proteobacteria bacterium]|nr:Hpt domain-containing protein [Pseudomonadota bacterium]